MRTDNLRFPPVRLQALRTYHEQIGPVYEIKRGEESLGVVYRHGGDRPWIATSKTAGVLDSRHTSFITAARRLARSNVHVSQKVQDYGAVRMIRVEGGYGSWYTILFHQHGTLIYTDTGLQSFQSGEEPLPYKRAQVLAVLNAADSWKRKNL